MGNTDWVNSCPMQEDRSLEMTGFVVDYTFFFTKESICGASKVNEGILRFYS